MHMGTYPTTSLWTLGIIFFFGCAMSSTRTSPEGTPVNHRTPDRKEGYGNFLFLPPGSVMIRNFIDTDGDGVDDRYQLQPGGKLKGSPAWVPFGLC